MSDMGLIQAINNGSISRQKGARRYPTDSTDEKTVVGITTMQGESILRHRGLETDQLNLASLQTDNEVRPTRPVTI